MTSFTQKAGISLLAALSIAPAALAQDNAAVDTPILTNASMPSRSQNFDTDVAQAIERIRTAEFALGYLVIGAGAGSLLYNSLKKKKDSAPT